jgi:flagellar hook-associated protein 3 FlgL
MNDQRLLADRIQRALPARPETLEFFESVQQFSDMLKADDWESIQQKLPQLAQIIDSVTLAQADIGSDIRSIEAEVMVNEDLKINLQAALASAEDLDYTTAITKMQAQMLSLEAAQSSFAKISQLSLFDYIR